MKTARPLPSSFVIRHSSLTKAFTLIELLVVIAVVILLTTLTMPAVRAMSKGNSRAQAANQIRAYLSQARAIAIAQHRQAGVVFFDETAAYSLPVNHSQTAMQLIVEDFNQTQYNPLPDNTVFIHYSSQRDYLPAGISVAALNDDSSRGTITGDESSSTLGVTRVVLFSPDGQMITRHGLARPVLGSGTPGTYPKASADWRFTTPGSHNANVGISSPGIFLYDQTEFAAQNIPTDSTGNAPRNAWIKKNATVILINTNTGALLP